MCNLEKCCLGKVLQILLYIFYKLNNKVIRKFHLSCCQCKNSKLIQVEETKKSRGRPKIILIEIVTNEMSIMKVT